MNEKPPKKKKPGALNALITAAREGQAEPPQSEHRAAKPETEPPAP